MPYNLSETAGVRFHIVFFEIFSLQSRSHAPTRLNGELPFFDSPGHSLSRGCFTIFPIPAGHADGPAPLDDPIHWTLVCLTTPAFWPHAVYATCQAPTLRAQLTYYVAEALAIVVTRWREVLQAVENLVDSGEVLRQADHLQDILFDDDTFSTSKRYFWAINLIHEAIRLLDDSIQQWIHHRKWSVTPWKKDLKGGRQYYWYEKSQEVLANAERQGEEACEELRLLRQEFQEKLEHITVRRDGLFNASAVMESRAATQLGENVKLLTFVSIFFLPLGLCVAIWSINESYSRTDLAIVTAVVAVATYFLTLNLNNIVRGLQKLYAPKRRALIEQMTKGEPDWERLAHRFKAFQRSEGGQRRPSEWMIAVFLGKRAALRVWMVLRRLWVPVWMALRRLWVWRKSRRRSHEEMSDSSSGVTMDSVELGG